jgi:predicted P-loop ATPase/GTPase
MPLFISGAYIGTDLMITADSALTAKVMQLLHFKPRTGHAVRTGEFYATDIAGPDLSGKFSFNTGSYTGIYAAESPDAIEPADSRSRTAFRYSENNTSAAVMHNGEVRAVVTGFPFETVTSQEERDRLMKQILDFILKK